VATLKSCLSRISLALGSRARRAGSSVGPRSRRRGPVVTRPTPDHARWLGPPRQCLGTPSGPGAARAALPRHAPAAGGPGTTPVPARRTGGPPAHGHLCCLLQKRWSSPFLDVLCLARSSHAGATPPTRASRSAGRRGGVDAAGPRPMQARPVKPPTDARVGASVRHNTRGPRTGCFHFRPAAHSSPTAAT